jgi:drug/metabolite transporter (DMT)-like permease
VKASPFPALDARMSEPIATPSLAASRDDLLMLVLLALLWSSSFMMIKIGIQSIGPFSLASGRLLIAAFVLAFIAMLRGESWPSSARDWLSALAVGLVGNALPFSLISWGEVHVASGLAAIMMGAMPIGVVLLAHFVTHDEPMTTRRVLGVLLGFSGLVILIGWEALGGLGAEVWAQLAIITAAFSYAVTSLTVRLFVRNRGCGMASLTTLMGGLMLLPVVALHEWPAQMPTQDGWLALLGLGLLPTALATVIYFKLLGRIGATVFAQVNYMIPILGVGWGVLLLDETPGVREAIALTLILSGVMIVNREARR